MPQILAIDPGDAAGYAWGDVALDSPIMTSTSEPDALSQPGLRSNDVWLIFVEGQYQGRITLPGGRTRRTPVKGLLTLALGAGLRAGAAAVRYGAPVYAAVPQDWRCEIRETWGNIEKVELHNKLFALPEYRGVLPPYGPLTEDEADACAMLVAVRLHLAKPHRRRSVLLGAPFKRVWPM